MNRDQMIEGVTNGADIAGRRKTGRLCGSYANSKGSTDHHDVNSAPLRRCCWELLKQPQHDAHKHEDARGTHDYRNRE